MPDAPGISFILLAGGEPLLRRDILDETQDIRAELERMAKKDLSAPDDPDHHTYYQVFGF